jgi:hypothetical protein
MTGIKFRIVIDPHINLLEGMPKNWVSSAFKKRTHPVPINTKSSER